MQGMIITGTHSGCGKTTVTLGMLAALRKKGLTVQPFKAGPDFIDAGLHRMACGRTSRNLDLWMCGDAYVKACFQRHAAAADVSVVEGVMGLYDGGQGTAGLASALGLPVFLVVDGYGMAESAGAVVEGFRSFGRGAVNIAGVIFNRVASPNHFNRLKEGVKDIPVLGSLPRDLNFEIPHRHLGLVTAEEDPLTLENLDRLADTIISNIDIDAMLSLGCRVNGLTINGKASSPQATPRPRQVCRVAVAYDRAFCFYYEDNLDLLRDAGAEIVFFSPLADKAIPAGADAVYIGGGYPELYAETLSQNSSMLASVRDWAEASKTMYAECGGLMYLSEGLYDQNSCYFPMAGVFQFRTKMRQGRSSIGYREVLLKNDGVLGQRGSTLRGHEFHYSEIAGGQRYPQDALQYIIKDRAGAVLPDEGYQHKNTLAGYIHLHFGSNPNLAKAVINFCKDEREQD
jgi:cobyrinic acid a,c-diamide synthase